MAVAAWCVRLYALLYTPLPNPPAVQGNPGAAGRLRGLWGDHVIANSWRRACLASVFHRG